MNVLWVMNVDKVGMNLSCQPAKKWGSQSHNCKGANSANNLNEQGNGLAPRTSRKVHRLPTS